MHGMKPLSLPRLGEILAIVAAGVRRELGPCRLAIGGGSAPALLDHLYAGTPLCMRDLDLILVAGRPVEAELARRIGAALDGPAMRFLPQYVYPRRRARASGDPWTAGWGVLWDSRGVEVDLSMFHDETALALNGLLDVDRILVPLPPDRPFEATVAAMQAAGSAAAARSGMLIDDPSGGYAAWSRRTPAIAAWHAVEASPVECAMRIVRTCVNKLGLVRLPAALAEPLRDAIARGPECGDRYVRVRTLIKLLHDERAGVELEMLQELGGFARWLPEIGAALDRAGGVGDLKVLLRVMSPAQRERVLAEFAVAEPGFASRVRTLAAG
ncbi:MAG TPA: hypothetical protein VEX86_01265 [Longimicrobium sp.]|nr:hypothetical protein [Longimicrobium sp.]